MFTKLISFLKRKILPKPGKVAHRRRGTLERVRLGVGVARIQRITPQGVEYTNEAGVDCVVELTRSAKEERPMSIVGFRGMLDDPPWVRFLNERSTRFEFTDSDEAYETLLYPLYECGWATEDAN